MELFKATQWRDTVKRKEMDGPHKPANMPSHSEPIWSILTPYAHRPNPQRCSMCHMVSIYTWAVEVRICWCCCCVEETGAKPVPTENRAANAPTSGSRR